jgi:hypothetical protein
VLRGERAAPERFAINRLESVARYSWQDARMRRGEIGIAAIWVLMLTACGSSGSGAAQNGVAGSSASGAGGATSEGSAGTAGAAGTAGTAGAPAAPPHVVGACDQLGDVGTLQNITPAALDFAHWCSPGSAACSAPGAISTYGAHGLAADPNNAGTVYLGTAGLGFWKTTDCGATWLKIDTGAHQAEIDSGRNWTLVYDSDHKLLYSANLTAGLWRARVQ